MLNWIILNIIVFDIETVFTHNEIDWNRTVLTSVCGWKKLYLKETVYFELE